MPSRGTIEERIVKLARAKKDVSPRILPHAGGLRKRVPVLTIQVQDIVVGTKSLTDVAKPSEIVSLFMDDEELAESVAKRKQAEAHGYVAPSIVKPVRSGFGDGLPGAGTTGDEDEDDFFSLKRKVPNGEEMDEDPDAAGSAAAGAAAQTRTGGGGGSKAKSGKSKRKAEGERESESESSVNGRKLTSSQTLPSEKGQDRPWTGRVTTLVSLACATAPDGYADWAAGPARKWPPYVLHSMHCMSRRSRVNSPVRQSSDKPWGWAAL